MNDHKEREVPRERKISLLHTGERHVTSTDLTSPGPLYSFLTLCPEYGVVGLEVSRTVVIYKGFDVLWGGELSLVFDGKVDRVDRHQTCHRVTLRVFFFLLNNTLLRTKCLISRNHTWSERDLLVDACVVVWRDLESKEERRTPYH